MEKGVSYEHLAERSCSNERSNCAQEIDSVLT